MHFRIGIAPLVTLSLLLTTNLSMAAEGDRIKNMADAVGSGAEAKLLKEIGAILQSGILQRIVDSMAKDIADIANDSVPITYPCLNDTEMIIADLSESKPYALQFIDADAKLPAGILQGQWSWTGDYQQCNDIISPFNESTGHSFNGNYKTVLLYRNGLPLFEKFLPLSIGVCLPDSCTQTDVRALMNSVLTPLAGQNITVSAVETDDTPSFGGGAISATVISGVLVVLVICGTLVDILCKPVIVCDRKINIANTDTITDAAYSQDETNIILARPTANDEPAPVGVYKRMHSDNYGATYSENGSQRKCEIANSGNDTKSNIVVDSIRSFSFFNNTSKLLSTSTANGPLACLNGLRVISMWWVIQGHTYSFVSLVLDNMVYYRTTLSNRLSFQAIMNGTYSVDSFFFLSGLLVAYMALTEWKKRGRMNWVYYFVHRYWRLTPVYAFVILLFTTMTTYLISGPYRWLVVSPQGFLYTATNNCHKYWWSNLLYLNNLYPDYGSTTGCMGWAWYLANDMQFYVLLSPVIIILLHKNKVVGWLVSAGLILIGIAIRAGLVSLYGLRLMDGGRTKRLDDHWGDNGLYVHPWARFTVYLVGMLTGHILQSTNCKVQLNKFISLVGWCVATATALSIVYGMYYYNSHPGETMSIVASGFYNSLNRTAWSLCLAWLTVACVSGYGGWVNAILSWKIWAPIGRLTYCAYLLHPIILVTFYFNAKTPYHFTDLFMITTFVSMTAITYGASYILSMLAEAPMMQLEKVLLKLLKNSKLNTCGVTFSVRRIFSKSSCERKTSFNRKSYS